MSKQTPKSEAMPDPEELTGVVPNLVTHIATKSQALDVRDETIIATIVGAMEREMLNGRQFYTLPIGQTWCVFYNGQVMVHR